MARNVHWGDDKARRAQTGLPTTGVPSAAAVAVAAARARKLSMGAAGTPFVNLATAAAASAFIVDGEPAVARPKSAATTVNLSSSSSVRSFPNPKNPHPDGFGGFAYVDDEQQQHAAMAIAPPRASTLAPPPPLSRVGKRRATAPQALDGFGPPARRVTAKAAQEVLVDALNGYDGSLEDKLRLLRQIVAEVKDELVATEPASTPVRANTPRYGRPATPRVGLVSVQTYS